MSQTGGEHKEASPPAIAGRGDAAADALLPRMYLLAYRAPLPRRAMLSPDGTEVCVIAVLSHPTRISL